ncbi:MAG: hypothetical protein ACRYE9_02595 [Janthinobacterium lividum]
MTVDTNISSINMMAQIGRIQDTYSDISRFPKEYVLYKIRNN